jgi:hypothetical protein
MIGIHGAESGTFASASTGPHSGEGTVDALCGEGLDRDVLDARRGALQSMLRIREDVSPAFFHVEPRTRPRRPHASAAGAVLGDVRRAAVSGIGRKWDRPKWDRP